ncbi:MAG TPA: SPOR domain-containing protein [Clostridia bacterium]|nr:SPOR domain-containing protein [Clostridia bacterium]
MVRIDRKMKNERILEVLIVMLIIPFVSLLVGYFISRDIVEPNLPKPKDSANFKEVTVKGIDLFEVVLSSYSDFETVKYHEDLMRVKGIYSFISKDSDKYLLIGGVFLDKEQATLCSSSLEASGIFSEVSVKKGPSIKIGYDKKLTSEMDDFINKLHDFRQICEYMSAISYKAFNDKTIEEKELGELKARIENFLDNNSGNFNEEKVSKIKGKVTDIVNKMATDIKKIEISAALQDKSTFSLLQQLLWQSCEEYNDFLKIIAIQNQ